MIDYVQVGKISKPFGVQGDLKVKPNIVYSNDLMNADVWFLKVAQDAVPYFVEKIQDSSHFLVKFEDVNTPEEARSLSGSQILLRRKDVSVVVDDRNDYTGLVGYSIFDFDKEVGTIIELEEYPQQIMAKVKVDKKEILIPFVEEWIKNIDIDNSLILMELPDGLVKSQF